MAYQLFQLPRQLNISSNLTLLSAAKAYFYVPGTTTPRDTYSDPELATPHTNPVVADAAGVFAPIYLNPTLEYKVTLKTSADVELYSTNKASDQFLSAAVIGSVLWPRTAAEIAAGVTPTSYAYPPLNVQRYGTTWDAIQTAINVANAASGGCVYLPAGQYTKASASTINMRSNVRITGDGYKSEIFVPNGANWSDNVLKFESITKASADNIRINGNRASTGGGTRYGFYFGGADQCSLTNVYVHACEGDGIHAYDSDGCVITGCQSFDNLYHGIELEQTRDSVASSNNCYSNLRHGIYVFEGEVGATGSKGLIVSANACHDNTQYGIAVQGPLTEDITVHGNSVRNNGEYGITIFDQVKGAVVSGNIVAYNGYTGIYLFRIKRAIVLGNQLRNNSQDTHGGYQEIHLDSQVADTLTRSQFNVIAGNVINIDGATKSAYGIKENSTSDGPNIVQGNSCPVSGSSGTISVLHETGANNSFLLCKNNYGRIDLNRGTATFDGDGAETEFLIPHELSPDEPRGVSVTAGSPDASGARSVASDATNIIVTFTVAPIAGTGNVILRWSATT